MHKRTWTTTCVMWVLTAFLMGCGTDTETPANDTSGEADAGQTTADTGTSTGDVGTVDTAKPKPSFELGTNITGKNTRKYYSPVPEGSSLNVELGPQGLWMVVLAFKTQGLLKPPLYLSGSIEVEGNDSAGKLALKKQKTILSDDGYEYYYNFWLVVKNDNLPLPSAPADVAGKTATIVLELTDADGKKHVETRHVKLTGGPNG